MRLRIPANRVIFPRMTTTMRAMIERLRAPEIMPIIG
jgi:hypothetical protein